MDEEQIVATLRQNIPVPTEPAPVSKPDPLIDEQSSVVENAVSELTLLKLGNELGVDRPNQESSDKLKYIYEQLSTDGISSHEAILERLTEYLTRLGLTFREDRFARLYLWLKLNEERILIEKEMDNTRG